MSESLSALYLQNPQLAIALRRRLEAEQQMKEGTSGEPIRSPWQGLNRLAQGLIGGYQAGQQDKAIQETIDADNAEVADFSAIAAQLINKGQQAPAAPATTPAAPATPMTGMPAPAAPAGDMSLPRGIRNNNPLNLTFVAGQPGVQGSDGRFGVYPDMESGYKAAANQLALYGQRGINTLAGMINRWAPPNENNTAAYIDRVAKATGIDPNAKIDLNDPAVVGPIMEAMAHHENGRPVPRNQQYASLPPAATDAGSGGDVPRETPVAPGAAAAMAPPTASAQPEVNPMMQLFLRYGNSRNPRIQRSLEALKPFISKMEPPNLQTVNVGGEVRTFNPRTGQLGPALGAANDFTPLPQSVEEQKRRLAGPTNVSPNNTVLDPVTNQPIYRAPPAPPSTFEEAAARNQANGGQSATEFRSGQTQATESAQTIQKNMDEQGQRASAAAGRLPMYDRALAGLDKMPPGALMDTRMRIAGLAQELGLNIGDVANLPEAQLRQAIARNLELVMTPRGQGQITESERKLIRDQIDIMLSTPDGTKQIIALAKANDTRDIERSGIYRQFIDQLGVVRDVAGLRKALSEYDAQAPWKGLMLPPPESPAASNAAPQQRQGARPVVNSPADAAKLPPGSEFQTPDGRILRVPMR